MFARTLLVETRTRNESKKDDYNYYNGDENNDDNYDHDVIRISMHMTAIVWFR